MNAPPTTAPQPPSGSLPPAVAIDLRRVDAGLAIVDAIRSNLTVASETVLIDRLTIGATGVLADLDLEALLRLGSLDHTVHITAESGSWTLTVRADGPAQPTVDTDGDPTSSELGRAQIDAVGDAVAVSDARAALDATSGLTCEIRLEINNDPVASHCHWIARIGDLPTLLDSTRWHTSASALAHGPAILVAADLTSESVSTGPLIIQGPDAPWREAPAHFDDSAYRGQQARDGRLMLPSPTTFAWTAAASPAASPAAQQLAAAFHGVARRLAWYWMAADTDAAQDGAITVTYAGARTVSFTLSDSPASSSVDDDLALYRWAATGNDPARQEALQHAISLAVSSADDLASGAAPALRTARTLYELSRRTAITEALAAHRSARQAALDAARAAADTARQTAGKTVERSLLQVAAATAVVLSNAINLLGRAPAIVLLFIVAALSATSLTVALKVELTSADKSLEAEKADLDQYRDVLASDDIAAIRGIHAIASAEADVTRARITSWIVYPATAVAVVIIGGLLVLTHKPKPVNTTTTPAPVTSATVSKPPGSGTTPAPATRTHDPSPLPTADPSSPR